MLSYWLFCVGDLGVFRFLVNWLSKNTDINTIRLRQRGERARFLTLLYTERRVTEMHDVNRSFGLANSSCLGSALVRAGFPVWVQSGQHLFLAQRLPRLGRVPCFC